MSLEVGPPQSDWTAIVRAGQLCRERVIPRSRGFVVVVGFVVEWVGWDILVGCKTGIGGWRWLFVGWFIGFGLRGRGR